MSVYSALPSNTGASSKLVSSVYWIIIDWSDRLYHEVRNKVSFEISLHKLGI